MYDSRWLPLAAAIVALACPSGTRADDDPTLGADLPGLLAHAEQHNPGLHALALEHEVATARADAAGALEDPAVEIEQRDVNEASSTRLLVTQTLPLWGKRGLRSSAARSDAASVGFELDDRRAELHLGITESYSRYWHAARAGELLEELAGTLGALEELARARYAAGLAPQQDALKATVERTELSRRRIAYDAQRESSAAALNALLARPIDAPLAAPREPPPAPAVPPLEQLASRLVARNPAIASRRAASQGAELAETLVRRNRYPDVTLGVAPIRRGGSFETWDALLGFTLPLQQGRRRAEEREARLRREAAEARREATATELLGELGSTWAELRAVDRQSALLRSTLLPQAEAGYRSALASYQVASVDFTTLLEAQRQWRQSRLDLLEAEEQSHMLAARIERLAGEER